MKHIIWTNDLDFDEWKEDLQDQYPDYDTEELRDIMYETNDDYLDDEKTNLNIKLGNDIVMVGRLHLWSGVQHGYKFIQGSNLNCIFTGTCGDYITWFVEGEDVLCSDTHHDGTNLYTYRLLKLGVDREDFEEFAWDNGVEKAVEKMTDPLGHYVAEVYGFDLEGAAV